MKRVAEQLDRESLLVLYLAGELSPDERRQVEGLLSTDPAVRAELQQLQAAHGMVEEGLDAADRAQRLPVDVRVAERHLGRMIREWQAVRPATPPTVVQKVVGLKYPWWIYPTTAAAAVFLAFLVWWGNTPLRNNYQQPLAINTDQMQQQPPTTGESSQQEEVDPQAQLAADLEQSFSHPSHEGIQAAEGELYALSKDTEDWESVPQQPQDVNQ